MAVDKDTETPIKISETLFQTNETCSQGCCLVLVCRPNGISKTTFEVRKTEIEELVANETIGTYCSRFDFREDKCEIINAQCLNVRPLQS